MRGWCVVVGLLAACGGGPYGHERVYTPLDGERDATTGAAELDPVMAKRQPDDWVHKKVSAYGVVTAREDQPGQGAALTLSLRALQPRNLCMNTEADSCRTTVTDREFAIVRATVTIGSPDDATGPISVGVGSLVRVVGALETDPTGTLVIRATYYRHWPTKYYVTTKDAAVLRQ